MYPNKGITFDSHNQTYPFLFYEVFLHYIHNIILFYFLQVYNLTNNKSKFEVTENVYILYFKKYKIVKNGIFVFQEIQNS